MLTVGSALALVSSDQGLALRTSLYGGHFTLSIILTLLFLFKTALSVNVKRVYVEVSDVCVMVVNKAQWL